MVDRSGRLPFSPAFGLVWLGQVASTFGSGLTTFALSVWVYQQTQSLTQFGLVVFVNALVIALSAPWVGVLCDRYPRQRIMLVSDTGAAALSAVVLVLVATSQLRMWQVMAVVAVDAVLSTMHQVAWRSLVPTLVARERLANANGLIESGLASSTMLAPLAAGFLLGWVGLEGIVLIDLATFALAAMTLLLARIPVQPPCEAQPVLSWHQSLRMGWNYLHGRGELRALLGVVIVMGVVVAALQVLFTPMVLARHGEVTLGVLLTTSSLGMALGGLHMLFRRQQVAMGAVFTAQLLMGLCLVALGLSGNAVLLGLFAFLVYGLSQQGSIAVRTIWQCEVAADMRGRVFALISAISAAVLPVAYLGAPWLAERVLAPWLALGHAAPVAALVGSGPAGGAGLLLALIGLGLVMTSLLWARLPGWQNLDRREAAWSAQG